MLGISQVVSDYTRFQNICNYNYIISCFKIITVTFYG